MSRRNGISSILTNFGGVQRFVGRRDVVEISWLAFLPALLDNSFHGSDKKSASSLENFSTWTLFLCVASSFMAS